MRYVSLGERVLKSLGQPGPSGTLLRDAIVGIETAESDLVRAYGEWRDAIQLLADGGNAEAKRVLERTLWDLT